MKNTIKMALILGLICLCIVSTVVSTYFCTRYGHDFDRLRDLESQVASLEFRMNDRWATTHVWLDIDSADKSTGSNSFVLHLVSGTNGVQRFQIPFFKEYGRSVAAWVSEWKPRGEMMKFEQFDVSPTVDRRGIEILAKPRTGETINMEFGVSILVHRFGEREESQPDAAANATSPHH